MNETEQTLTTKPVTTKYKHQRNRGLMGAACVLAVALMGVCCVKGGDKVHQGQKAKSPVAAATEPSANSARPAAGTANFERAESFEGYALTQPDERHELPKSLTEVSGLTDLSNTEVGCVQDEEGVVFVYSLAERKITNRIPFGEPADYEGITRVGTTLFVLRSDGVLFEIANYAGERKVTSMDLEIPARDNEGLCYDQHEKRLLIAPKSRLGKDDEARQTKWLFAYDLEQRHAASEPVIKLDLTDVFDGREKLRETKRGRKRVLPSRFLPSSVTIHPTTGELFVISAIAGNLAVFDRSGKLKQQFPLERSLFPQPEGITFLPNGDLVIVNEGAGGRATLLLFHPKKQ